MPSLCFGPELELTEDDRNMGITMKIKKLPEDEPRTAMVLLQIHSDSEPMSLQVPV